jgi:hypothetical protein
VLGTRIGGEGEEKRRGIVGAERKSVIDRSLLHKCLILLSSLVATLCSTVLDTLGRPTNYTVQFGPKYLTLSRLACLPDASRVLLTSLKAFFNCSKGSTPLRRHIGFQLQRKADQNSPCIKLSSHSCTRRKFCTPSQLVTIQTLHPLLAENNTCPKKISRNQCLLQIVIS